MHTENQSPTDAQAVETNAAPSPRADSTETLAALFHKVLKLMMRAHHLQGHAEHAQMRVLGILRRHQPINQRELMDMLNVRSASLSELLGKLELRNLLTRTRDEQDKRNIVITLTESGEAAAEELHAAHRRSADDVFAALSEAEREQLTKLLGKLSASMERHIAECHPGHDHGEHDRDDARMHGRHAHQHGHRHLCGRGEEGGRHGVRARGPHSERGMEHDA